MKTMMLCKLTTHNLMTTNSKTEDTIFSVREERDDPIDNVSQMV